MDLTQVRSQFQSELLDPRLSDVPALPHAAGQSGGKTKIDVARLVAKVKSLLEEHDPSKVSRVIRGVVATTHTHTSHTSHTKHHDHKQTNRQKNERLAELLFCGWTVLWQWNGFKSRTLTIFGQTHSCLLSIISLSGIHSGIRIRHSHLTFAFRVRKCGASCVYWPGWYGKTKTLEHTRFLCQF